MKELEDRVFMEEFLAAMDEESRAICHQWLRGDEWKEIAGRLRLLSAARERQASPRD